MFASRGVDTKDFQVTVLEFSRGAVVTMEKGWILSPDNSSLVNFNLELVGEKGQIRADPTHNGGLRRHVDGGFRYNDYIGVTPAGASRVSGPARRTRPATD